MCSTSDNATIQQQAVILYDTYPRKAARRPGIAEAVKALKKESFDFLLDRVKEFRRVWENATTEQKQLCPHARTWFHQERYHDDPADWWAFRRRLDRDSKDHHDFGGLQDFSD